MSKKKRRHEPAQLSDLMAKFAGPRSPNQPRPAPPIVDALTWRRIVGVGVAQRSRPMALRRGTLWVQVISSAWAQELSLLQTTLLERLAKYGVRADQVRFRVGALGEPARPVKIEPPLMPRAPLPPALDHLLAAVSDETLRHVLTDAAALNLAWQRGLILSRTRATPDLRSYAVPRDFSASTETTAPAAAPRFSRLPRSPK